MSNPLGMCLLVVDLKSGEENLEYCLLTFSLLSVLSSRGSGSPKIFLIRLYEGADGEKFGSVYTLPMLATTSTHNNTA